MSVKIFPTTFDDDTISVLFEYEEEKRAFEEVVQKLEERIMLNGKNRETSITDFEFPSTLAMDVATARTGAICQIVGLKAFSVWSRRSSTIVPWPHKKK